jgi:hypothetical protein
LFHNAGEKRRGRRRHPNRGRSDLHTVYGCGQTPQDVVRVSNMDGERETSRRQEANNLHTCIPLAAVACLDISVKKAVAWPPRAPNSVTTKGMKRITGAQKIELFSLHYRLCLGTKIQYHVRVHFLTSSPIYGV